MGWQERHDHQPKTYRRLVGWAGEAEASETSPLSVVACYQQEKVQTFPSGRLSVIDLQKRRRETLYLQMKVETTGSGVKPGKLEPTWEWRRQHRALAQGVLMGETSEGS